MENTITKPQDRVGLKKLFENGIIPSEEDFANLIDSVLIKRDDHFFGVWQKGAGYREGDVVLYTNDTGMGIYVFVSVKQAEEIAKDQGKDCDCIDDDCCGNEPPGKCCRWQLIHVNSDDNDWQIVQDGTNSVMYAKVYGRLGVGTDTPEAFLHLNAAQEGAGSQLLFSPVGEGGDARLRLKSGVHLLAEDDKKATYVDQTIALNNADTTIEWLTNAPLGYVFKKQTTAGTAQQPPSDMTLMLIGSDQNLHPRIGIGTLYPQATLEVTQGGNSIQQNVTDTGGPQLILLKSTGKNSDVRLTQTIDSQYAKWTTSAAHGFLFADRNDKPLVGFDGTGNVGIGTATPTAKLEIIDEKGNKGRFSFDVDSVTPMLTVTNFKNDGAEVNLSLSVDNNKTVLDTDAQQGFEFRKEGKRIVALIPDSNAKTPTFSTMVDGFYHADGLYVRSIKGTVSDIDSGLAFLKTLKPKQRLAEGDNHMQMGFVFTGKTGRSSEIARQFPDDTFGIAQHNLIALLVRSVQELQDQIDSLQQEISDLRGNGQAAA